MLNILTLPFFKRVYYDAMLCMQNSDVCRMPMYARDARDMEMCGICIVLSMVGLYG